MREVVRRRYTRLKVEATKENPLPDLIMVDGGKGQLSSAVAILSELGLSDIPKLLQQLRDEAHRFAITFHRDLRGKAQVSSQLDGIKGLGPKKKELLLKTFGSVKKIKEASAEEILAVKGITAEIEVALRNKLSE